MKVKVQNCVIGTGKAVTFSRGDRSWVYIMNADLAKSLEMRLNAMDQFRYGILQDGKVLVAMFKDRGDRDAILRLMALAPEEEQRLTAFDCEGE